MQLLSWQGNDVPLTSQSHVGVDSLGIHGSPISGFPTYPGKHSLHLSPIV